MPPRNVFTACQACRRLKRKCSRDLPSCTLCTRLHRYCDYSTDDGDEGPEKRTSPKYVHSRVARRSRKAAILTEDLSSDYKPRGGLFNKDFPSIFFLDSESFRPLARDAASFSSPSFLEPTTALLRETQEAVIGTYVATTQEWLPILSIKRLHQAVKATSTEEDGCFPLLLLCMTLISRCQAMSPENDEEYLLARQGCFEAEAGGFISLRLLQALVLLAVYELGHAIYPAAYLTIGRAVRLGVMMGLHNTQHAPQLLAGADTWTLSEEQRRTWWAIMMLDKIVVVGSPDLRVAAPEPSEGELLPCEDVGWAKGRICPNAALLTHGFHESTSLGAFAKTCQATHMLSKVLRHCATIKTETDRTQLLNEALGLHRALSALDSTLTHPAIGADEIEADGIDLEWAAQHQTALALCTLARFLLYNQYSCNEPDQAPASASRVTLEVEAQKASLDGITILASQRVAALAKSITSRSEVSKAAQRPISHSPVVAPCLYHAATECAWFIKEDQDDVKMVSAHEHILEALRALQGEWNVAGKYLEMLS